MRIRRSLILAVLTVTTAAALVPPGSSAAAEPVGPVTAAAQPSRLITLITGDRVRVTPQPGKPPEVRFETAKGSRSRGATISRTAGHTMVIPHSVAADVATGKLDRALFDVASAPRMPLATNSGRR